MDVLSEVFKWVVYELSKNKDDCPNFKKNDGLQTRVHYVTNFISR